MLDFILYVGFTILALFSMALCVYIGMHLAEEKRQGKSLPLFWEKKDE